MRLSLTFSVLFLLAAAPASRAQSSPGGDLGYVDPRVVEGWFDQPPRVEVNLRGALLRMAAQTAGEATDDEDEAKVGPLLKRISAIYVRIYDTEKVPMETLEARSTELTDRLAQQGWETVVRVREDDEQVSLQLRSRDEDTIAGLTVLVNQADGESVFVNIVGDISPEELGQLTGSIDGLDGLDGLGDASSNGDDNHGEDNNP